MISDNTIRYINGNYLTRLHYDGTREKRVLRVGENFEPSFPDSIDLKITNKCLLGCSFCHEASNPSGKTANWSSLKKVLDQLPKVGIELAIGGGDVFECPSLVS